MEIESYGSVCIEGGDQVGKGDATGRLINELEREGVNISVASFPIYATPVGTVLRLLLKQGYPEELLDEGNQLEAKMAIYALNRLEFLDVYLSDSRYHDSLLIFDRSPFSNAVTIGYGLSLQENWTEDEVRRYTDRAMDFDSLMISKLGLDRCIVQLKSEESEWRDIRGRETDLHETKDVQVRTGEVYELYKDILGDSWHQVVTKDDNGWRSRDDIFENLHTLVLDTYGDMGEIRQGRRMDIGIKEIVEKLYPKSEYSRKEFARYMHSLAGNNKNEMYASGCVLGKQIADSCLNVRFSSDEVREEFKRIVLSVPEVMDVFRYFLGDKYVAKLSRGLEL